jgi:hypothetical protein
MVDKFQSADIKTLAGNALYGSTAKDGNKRWRKHTDNRRFHSYDGICTTLSGVGGVFGGPPHLVCGRPQKEREVHDKDGCKSNNASIVSINRSDTTDNVTQDDIGIGKLFLVGLCFVLFVILATAILVGG